VDILANNKVIFLGGALLLKGTCYYCNKEFSKAGILKHMKSCKAMSEAMELDKNSSKANINKFVLEILSKYNKDYWIYISIDANAALKDLDQFLRDIWLECCGHLSMFRIDGKNYESEVDDRSIFGRVKNDMNVKLKDVVAVNYKMQYEYDFGSTTYLEIKVLDKLRCSNKGKKIEIIGRNNEVQLNCSYCEELAAYYDYENESYLCDNCYENHNEDDGMIEEIGYVNSPRAGVCGYQGSEEDEVPYLPNTKGEKVVDIKDFLDVKVEEEVNEEELGSQYTEIFSVMEKFKKYAVNHRVKRELKKWRPIEKNFSLEYHLNNFTKSELLGVAKNLRIDKISSLKKEELKNKILELYEEKVNLLIENMDVERFSLFLQLANEGKYTAYNNDMLTDAINYYRNRAFLFTGTIDDKEFIIMPEELQKIILHRYNEELEEQLEKNEELIRLFWGMCRYYGVVDLGVFNDLVKKYVEFDILTINLKTVLKDASDYYGEFDFNGYVGNDIMVDDIAHILTEQNRRSDLQFYPFKKEELLRVAQIDFQDETKAYKRLYDFFTENFDMDGDEAEDLIFSIEDDIKNDENFSEVVSSLLDNFEISNIEEANFIVNEVFKFANNTRQWVIKGYTPEELNKSSVIKEEKIGRNQLCPCGSGKKYKKCCGEKM
jgi:hypothetical protein